MRFDASVLTLLLTLPLAGCKARPRAEVPPDRPTRFKRFKRLKRTAWLAGTWISRGEGRVIQESWTQPHRGIMLGVNRTATVEHERFELLRIETTGAGLLYTAVPPGQATTSFTAVTATSKRVVFANPDHDFPQRVEYRRLDAEHASGPTMRASISNGDNSQQVQWDFERENPSSDASSDPASGHQIRYANAMVSREGEVLKVTIPGGFCARSLCAVVPTPRGPTLQMVVLESYNDCSMPATATCPAPPELPPLGEQRIAFLYGPQLMGVPDVKAVPNRRARS